MDRVRLGRVLGRGARMAARTAYEAVDAATSAPTPRQRSSRRPASVPELLQPNRVPAGGTLLHAAKAAGAGFARPLRNASRALWLELTGCFFALFALSFGLGAWHTRGEWASAVPLERHRSEAFCVLTVVFLYFSVSSFVRARKCAS